MLGSLAMWNETFSVIFKHRDSCYLLCIPWEYLSVIILKQDIYFGQDLERENEQNYIKQEWKHFSDHRSKLPHSNTATSVSKTTASPHRVWKLLKVWKCRIWILASSINFCPIKIDLSGNTVWPQVSGLQKLAKMNHFWHF